MNMRWPHRERSRMHNVAMWSPVRVRLRCKHVVTLHPVVTLGGKGWYVCPYGCGLKRGTRV